MGVKKAFEDSTYINVETAVKDIAVCMPVYKKNHPKNWKAKLISRKKDLFHNGVAPDFWENIFYVEVKSHGLPDEIFGRTNIALKITNWLEEGFTIDETVTKITPYLVRAYIPRGNFYFEEIGKELTINGFLGHYFQNQSDIRNAEWNEDFRLNYINNYNNVFKKLGIPRQ